MLNSFCGFCRLSSFCGLTPKENLRNQRNPKKSLIERLVIRQVSAEPNTLIY